MKFNNKLNLATYIKVVDDIVDGYFSPVTGEYTPHIGEMYTAYLYFKNCVISEEGDEVTTENIDVDGEADLEKLESILNNHEFIKAFEENVIFCSADGYVNFGNAFHNASLIVQSRVENGGLVAQRIMNGLTNISDTLKDIFTEDIVDRMMHVMEDISNGEISAESIATAYAHSDRFKQNTEDAKIIQLPEQK